MNYDVTVIITIHAEGRILHRTFRALNRSVRYAQARGVTAETLFVLDKCSDEVTRKIVDNWRKRLDGTVSVAEVNYGAVADARNFGVRHARGEYIALLDGDDLYGERLIYTLYETCRQDRNIIAHPQAEYLFPVEPFLRIYTAGNGAFLDLIYNNIFTVRTMAHKDIYLTVPSIRNTDIWAFQDWLWHCDVAAKGYRHEIAPGSIIAVRQKPFAKSLWQNNFALNKVIRPNELFRRIFLREFDGIKPRRQTEAENSRSFIARSIIAFLDKCYSENMMAYHFVVGLKRRTWSFFNKCFKNSLQDWVVEEIQHLSDIEPELIDFKNPTVRYTATHLRFYNVITEAMSKLVRAEKPRVYLLQDLRPNNFDRFLLSGGGAGDDNLFLITTNSFPNYHKNCLGINVTHIDIGNTYLIFEERMNLLHRLLLESEPEFIHVCGSQVALEMFSRYKNTFRNIKVVAAFNSPGDHFKGRASRTGLNWDLLKYSELVDFFDHIETDSIEYKKKLQDIFGIEDIMLRLCN